MVILPDGALVEMQWKQIKYQNHDNYIVFPIVPMVTNEDIIILPNKNKWKDIEYIFSFEEREEIILLIERIAWKRDIKLIELDCDIFVDREIPVSKGMIESTKGYIKLSDENLFDPNRKLGKEQVKSLFCRLEERFAESISGRVIIPRENILKGSVMGEVTIPILANNKNVIINYISI